LGEAENFANCPNGVTTTGTLTGATLALESGDGILTVKGTLTITSAGCSYKYATMIGGFSLPARPIVPGAPVTGKRARGSAKSCAKEHVETAELQVLSGPPSLPTAMYAESI
jgi:hypothetical protein